MIILVIVYVVSPKDAIEGSSRCPHVPPSVSSRHQGLSALKKDKSSENAAV